MKKISLTVNKETYELWVSPKETLLDILRDRLDLTGTKRGCDMGSCGACTVIIDGVPKLACLTLAVQCEDKEITTIEGLSAEGKLHPLQEAAMEKNAIQCGFCTPGMVLSAKALLDENPQPTEEEIKDAIAGNLCRCTGYVKIIDAIKSVSRGK